MFSSWDSNGNGYYGEYEHEINGKKYNDKVDLKPEVAIGRLACRNEIELKNALNKIMNYESNKKLLLIEGDSYPNDPCGNVWLDRCNRSIIENNSFYKNWYSIFLYHTNGCLIKRNEILHNEHGPQIVFSSNNGIEGNDICYNEHYGIYIDNESKGNEILRNNIINNAYNARDDGKSKWDYNYWSDYIGNKFKILWMIGFPKYIPKFEFDWHPVLSPYKI